jgi:hypothetical protein
MADDGAEEASVVQRQFSVAHLVSDDRRCSQRVGQANLVASVANCGVRFSSEPHLHGRGTRRPPHLGLFCCVNDSSDFDFESSRRSPQIDKHHTQIAIRHRHEIDNGALVERSGERCDRRARHVSPAIVTNIRSQPVLKVFFEKVLARSATGLRRRDRRSRRRSRCARKVDTRTTAVDLRMVH